MNKWFVFIAYCIISIHYTFSQQSDIFTDTQYNYKNAEYLFLDDAYKGAEFDFENLLNFTKLNPIQKENALFYSSVVSLLSQDKFAIEEYKNFKKKYPDSNLNEQAFYPLGNYYIHNSEFEKGVENLQKVNINSLTNSKKDNYYFNLAYAYFMTEDFKKSKQNLEQISEKDIYKNASDFMMGHINYTDGNYDAAYQNFEKLQQIEAFKDEVKPYLVQIYFNKKEYDKAISEGKDLIESNIFPELKFEISKIIGESLFQQKKYSEALPYLQVYIKNENNPSQADFYQLGYVLYKEENYTQAVQVFNKITTENSKMAQNAFYQLGNSYLKTNQKQEALSAFKSASEMSFNENLQQKAHYNYAKLSFDEGNPFESTSQALQNFITKYPNSENRQEINTLLLKSYLKSKNYSGALESLNQIKNKNSEEKKIEQEVALLFGIQLYNEGKYDKAIEYFPIAYKHSANDDFKAKALFWNAESNFRLENYSKAIDNLKAMEALNSQIEENKELHYALGYNYLKIRDFNNAVIAFQKYLNNPKEENKSDAEMRLADAYYGAANYDKANEYYDKVASSNNENSEEAQYNKGMIYGYKDDLTNKIKELEIFVKNYPKSEWYDDANFEIGKAYQLQNEYKTSNKYFEKVVKDKKEIELTALSMLGIAENYSDLNENEKAINEYKFIAKEFKNSDYTAQAVIAAKNVYLKLNRINEYEKWATSVGYNFSTEEKEDISFTAAQKLYLEGNYMAAIEELEEFLKNYTKSSRDITAKYYVGNSYFKTENFKNAEKYLKEIGSSPNQYQEDALAQLSQMYVKQDKGDEARFALEALEEVTQNNNYLQFADVELMYIYSDDKEYKKAKEKAERVLKNIKNAETVHEEANSIIARGNFFENKITDAKKQFSVLEKSKNTKVKAEALYYKAYFLNRDKKYESSNKVIFDLANNLSDQQYWGAKSLVLMADNYINLKDKYQATYTLEQVIENYKEFIDVVKEAKEKLQTIKK